MTTLLWLYIFLLPGKAGSDIPGNWSLSMPEDKTPDLFNVYAMG